MRHDEGVPPAEILISVDIEASGPTPSTGSLVAVGACLVGDLEVFFYEEIRPAEGAPWDTATEPIHHLTRRHLAEHGAPAHETAARWASWIEAVAGGSTPIMVGFNAAFDWMFVADLFHRHLGRNPFGVSAIDLKAVYLGRYAVQEWRRTTRRDVSVRHPTDLPMTHNALADARSQAELARLLLPSGLGDIGPSVRAPRSGHPGR
ncbi:hypothetical protein BH18CHL1_BH18CHL1_03700 [soil metagenome]